MSALTVTTENSIRAVLAENPANTDSSLILQYSTQAAANAKENAKLHLLIATLNAQIVAHHEANQSRDENYHLLETSHSALTARHNDKLTAAIESVAVERSKFLEKSQQYTALATDFNLTKLKITSLEKIAHNILTQPHTDDQANAIVNPSTKRGRPAKSTATTKPTKKTQLKTAPSNPRTSGRVRQASIPWTPAQDPNATSITRPVTRQNTQTEDIQHDEHFIPSTNDKIEPPDESDHPTTTNTAEEIEINDDDDDDDEHNDGNDSDSHHSDNTAELVASIKKASDILFESDSAKAASQPRKKLR